MLFSVLCKEQFYLFSFEEWLHGAELLGEASLPLWVWRFLVQKVRSSKRHMLTIDLPSVPPENHVNSKIFQPPSHPSFPKKHEVVVFVPVQQNLLTDFSYFNWDVDIQHDTVFTYYDIYLDTVQFFPKKKGDECALRNLLYMTRFTLEEFFETIFTLFQPCIT